jgi:hypothetical protein
MFPFDRPSSYGEMLNKIGIFTFLSTLGLTWVVAHFSPPVAAFLKSETTTVEIMTLKIPLLYVVPAAIIAIFARIVRLHDRISDMFGIRERFDLNRILIPLCQALQIPVDNNFREKLRNQRTSIMARTFYRYASFEEPKISKALVLGSIDRWTWYWISLELCAVLAIAGAVLLGLHAYVGASVVFVTLVVAVLVFSTYYSVCGRLADAQIEEILDDGQRAAELRAEFERLRSQP